MKRLRAVALGVVLAGLAWAAGRMGAAETEGGPAVPAAGAEGEKKASSAVAPATPAPAGPSAAVSTPAPASSVDTSALARSLAELKAEVRALGTRIESTRPTAPGPDSHTAKALEQIQTRIQGLEELLGPDLPRYGTVFSGLAAVLVLVAIGAIFWARPRAAGGSSVPGSVTRKLDDIQKAVSSLGAAEPATGGGSAGGAKSGNDLAAALVQATNALRSTGEKAARDEKELASLVEQLQAVGGGLQPAVEALNSCADDIRQERGALAGERAALEREKAELAGQAEARAAADEQAANAAAEVAEKLEAAEARLAKYEALWPAGFQGNSVLGSARDRVVAACAEGREEGIELFSSLVRWHHVHTSAERDRERWIAAADAVGRASCAFLAREPTDGMDPAEVLERAQLWTRAFKTPLEQTFPELKLNAVYPGDRFDTDRMEAIGSVSGGRQTVHQALSWSLLEKTAESTRVVRRAQVITT